MPKKKPYDPSDRNFPLSRSAIEEYLACARCFYQARRLGLKRPPFRGSLLPNTVDDLLKREFDFYRERQEPHPAMRGLPGDLVPFAHEDLGDWRNNRVGVKVAFEPAGVIAYGAVDDVWISRETGELHVVDYKTSSRKGEITEPGESYERQVEIYQWLLRGKGFAVSSVAYFVFEQVEKEAVGLNQVLRFKATLVPYEGETSWIEAAILKARDCLDAEHVPDADPDCVLCAWVAGASMSPESSPTED